MSAPDPVTRLQELLDRLEGARKRLEETDDPERAVDILRARRQEGHADA